MNGYRRILPTRTGKSVNEDQDSILIDVLLFLLVLIGILAHRARDREDEY